MNMSDLKPANYFAKQYGVKMLVFSGPGMGKTPIINSAPRPVLGFSEPGMLSMRGSNVPSYCIDTVARIDDFLKWALGSNEMRNYDTICLDSMSEMAEIVLRHEKGIKQNKMQMYGNLADKVSKWANDLFFLQGKHVYLICKQTHVETGTKTISEGGVFKTEIVKQARPYFPGQELNVQIPHKYDEILHLEEITMPGAGNVMEKHLAFRTRQTADVFARDRSGALAEFEPANLDYIFKKCMG